MTTFDEREQGYEAGFAHDQEMEFKAAARRDRMLGMWAAERMGLTGDEAANYPLSVMRADLKEPGDEDVVRKVEGDFAARAIDLAPGELRHVMDALLATARAELKAGR